MLNQYNKEYAKNLNQIAILDQDGNIMDSELYLFEAKNGDNITNLHPFFETIKPLLKEAPSVYEFNCINLEVNATDHVVDITLETLKDSNNAVLVINDLTKHYRAYQQLAQVRNESKIKTELLNIQNTYLKRKEAFKNNFITSLSHEIRMPINTISGFSILLENTRLDQSQIYSLQVIKDTNERLKRMINDILDISKIETGYFPIITKRFNLHNELKTFSDIYTAKSEAKNLQFTSEIDKTCPKYINGDKFRLLQILSNVIGNSIKFTDSGTIDFKVNCLKKTADIATLEFVISDTGIGIENSNLKSIFNSFHQISTPQSNQGVGLGLAIVKQLVTALKGNIDVKSKINKGTTFNITLDFNITEENEEHLLNSKETETKETYDYSILIAETQRKDQVKLSQIINSKYNCNLVFVDNGDDVIKQLYQSNFNLVLLNTSLHKMNGFDTARYIRNSEFKKIVNIPIIPIIENQDEDQIALFSNLKIKKIINKPLEESEIIKLLKSVLKKKRTK